MNHIHIDHSSDGDPPVATLTEPRRVLVVEDDEGMRKILRRTFQDAYEVHEAVDGEDGLARARELSPDVVISDQRMPRMDGVELLTRLKTELPRSVRVLVTGYDDYGPVVDALNAAGVHHYFEKPFHTADVRAVVDTMMRNLELEAERDALLAKLQASVEDLETSNAQLKVKETELNQTVESRTHELRESNDELREANLKLREMAVRDGLTGLFNHRTLVEHLDLEIARSQRYGRRFCLLFIDLDDFKGVNDQHGHQAGDAVLVGLSKLLRPGAEGMRRSDFVARYGGEEFCLMLPETPSEGGSVKAERLRKLVEQHDWSGEREGLDLKVTISVGVASFPDNADSADKLLGAADAALYEAKRGGKNQVVVAAR